MKFFASSNIANISSTLEVSQYWIPSIDSFSLPLNACAKLVISLGKTLGTFLVVGKNCSIWIPSLSFVK
ncbi:hypothetical protein [Mycoplasma capricolum]|uniref:hypothetical protein n=1 Tax=Mycoplasma capricolum TaxID=2095 RepID=UPI003DA20994